MYFRYIWQPYSTGITEKELKNVEIRDQTASLYLLFFLHNQIFLIQNHPFQVFLVSTKYTFIHEEKKLIFLLICPL